MGIELKIKWDGNAPGLHEHRLSISAFGTPLRNLLAAVRRSASNIVRESIEKRSIDVGRLVAEAERIDIQIATLRNGSADFDSVVAVEFPPGPQLPLLPEALAEDSVDRVLQDIERESIGIQRNAQVREFLQSLPIGLMSQDYALVVDGTTKRTVHIGELKIAPDLASIPCLYEAEGRVIGLGLEPGKTFIRIKESAASGTEVTLGATARQVEFALEHRTAILRLMAVAYEDRKRVLRIQLVQERRVRLHADEYVFKKWGSLLARLAQ